MGNSSSSSAGTMVGSWFGGILLAPFTGGLSMIPAAIGTGASAIALANNAQKENEYQNRTGQSVPFDGTDFVLGLVGGGVTTGVIGVIDGMNSSNGSANDVADRMKRSGQS
jgi:hypothetical protein